VTTLAEDLKHLVYLKRKDSILAKRRKVTAREVAQWNMHCYDRMVTEGCKPEESSIRLDNVVHVPHSTDYAVIQNRAELEEYLRENEMEGLIVSGIREGELNQLVREKLDNNEPLPPGLGSYTKNYVSVRGATPTTKEAE
jgi:hypothetical protein